MTESGYEMFLEYLEHQRSIGSLSFTIEQVMDDLKVSRDSVFSGIRRLKKEGRIISPAKGFYIIIPPEHRQRGCIPAEELVPLLMDHLNIDYYAGLLSAGLYHGATHQKPGSFQIIINKQIKRKLIFGQIKIDCIYKKSIKNLPTQNIIVKTGYLKISSPELTAIDLLKYSGRSGGLNHIATVLSELVESIDPKKLIALFQNLKEDVWFQRLGYLLEHIEPMDEKNNEKVIHALYECLSLRRLRTIALAPEISSKGFPLSKRWKVIENTTVESDL